MKQETSISDLLDAPAPTNVIQHDLSLEQRKDPTFKSIIACMEEGVLPQDKKGGTEDCDSSYKLSYP